MLLILLAALQFAPSTKAIAASFERRPIEEVFSFLSQYTGRKIVLQRCGRQRVTLKTDGPVAVEQLFDQLAKTAQLGYADDGAAITVTCLRPQYRLVPAPNGFKIFSIGPGSDLAKRGFQNGDVVTHLDGEPVKDVERALNPAAVREYTVVRRGQIIKL